MYPARVFSLSLLRLLLGTAALDVPEVVVRPLSTQDLSRSFSRFHSSRKKDDFTM